MKLKKIVSLRLSAFRFLLRLTNFIRLTEAFFLGGETCLCCGSKCGVIPLCKKCSAELAAGKPEKRCNCCGKELISESDLCSVCRENRVLRSVDFSFPLFSYSLWKKNLLFAWKTEEKRVLSPFFAELVYKQLKEISAEGTVLPVVPVPPRPGKIKYKGWDQIEELCFYLKHLYGVEVLPVLKRLTTYQQKKLNRQKRLEQIKKAYVLKTPEKNKSLFKRLPDTVVLVDDVMTTGSTIEACAEELKKAGIKQVKVITLFIVD